MPEQETSQNKSEFALRRFKEYVAAGIAGTVMLAMVFMFIVAVRMAENFDQIKDILLVVNPLVGVVLGYYFNKVSTEARAENAEATAQTAVANAQEAAKARDSAMTETQEAKAETEVVKTNWKTVRKEADEIKTTLMDVTLAAEDMMEKAPLLDDPVLERGSISPQIADPVAESIQNLRAALNRAHQVIG